MSRIIDFHSHILPGIDDGSASVEESAAMLRQEAEQGVEHVIATPHFYAHHDTPSRFLDRRNEAEARLRQAVSGQAGLPRLEVGAEVYFFPGISDSERLSELTIGGKRCILLEMPPSPWTESMYREMEQIWLKRGITPVIAHVDRYIGPLRTHRIPERLAELPVLVQANASFFLKQSTSAMAMRMLRRDQIHLLGSDCHNLRYRPPNLGHAVEKIRRILGEDVLERIGEYQRSVLDMDVLT